jgi:tetratricopeptide (TPR) repeat protein
LIEAITTIAPNYAEGWHMRAEMEQAADDETAALVSLQKVVLLNPRHFMALAELADRLEDYGDKAGALKLYRRALELDPQMDIASRKVRRADSKGRRTGHLNAMRHTRMLLAAVLVVLIARARVR